MKVCTTCGQAKADAEFAWHIRALGQRKSHCRDCGRTKMAEQRRKRSANGKEAAYQIKRRARQTDILLRRNFGITFEHYAGLFEAQGGMCAICGKPEQARAAPMRRPGGQNLANKRLSVDHDHVSGQVRGLLCSGCNPGIGHFRDDPALLRAAADYLERWRSGLSSPNSDMANSI